MVISGKEHPFKLQIGMENEERAVQLIGELEDDIRIYVFKAKDRKSMEELEAKWKEICSIVFEKPAELPSVQEIDSGIAMLLGASFISRALSQIVSAKRASLSQG